MQQPVVEFGMYRDGYPVVEFPLQVLIKGDGLQL